MNILFLTTGTFHSINEHSGYPDLLREFKKNGHKVYVVSTNERRFRRPTELTEEDGSFLLRVRIGNLTKTNIIEKGISLIRIEGQFKSAIKRYFSDVRFDLVLYSTPPITLVSAIEYVKRRDGATTYLLLKDIFPQNAVDIGLMSTSGLKGFLYRHFRKKEERLYEISDHIGCMSEANVNYVIAHNPQVDPRIVEVSPNCIEVIDKSIGEETRIEIREKYGIPINRKVFVYGGNLGKPQGVPFLIECLRKCERSNNAFFLIVGDGTEYELINNYIISSTPNNVKLMKKLPKEDYDSMVGACDVGLVFLDHRFTIPNFPSRILSYMAAKIPVIAVTDVCSDMGHVIDEGGFGWWCESNDSKAFAAIIEGSCDANLKEMGETAFSYLLSEWDVKKQYISMISSISKSLQ